MMLEVGWRWDEGRKWDNRNRVSLRRVITCCASHLGCFIKRCGACSIYRHLFVGSYLDVLWVRSVVTIVLLLQSKYIWLCLSVSSHLQKRWRYFPPLRCLDSCNMKSLREVPVAMAVAASNFPSVCYGEGTPGRILPSSFGTTSSLGLQH